MGEEKSSRKNFRIQDDARWTSVYDEKPDIGGAE